VTKATTIVACHSDLLAFVRAVAEADSEGFVSGERGGRALAPAPRSIRSTE
jgi:hypothetical protein